jgi:hypothetical protein
MQEGWLAGDRIYGVGIETTGITRSRGLNVAFLHTDKCGDSIKPRQGVRNPKED